LHQNLSAGFPVSLAAPFHCISIEHSHSINFCGRIEEGRELALKELIYNATRKPVGHLQPGVNSMNLLHL